MSARSRTTGARCASIRQPAQARRPSRWWKTMGTPSLTGVASTPSFASPSAPLMKRSPSQWSRFTWATRCPTMRSSSPCRPPKRARSIRLPKRGSTPKAGGAFACPSRADACGSAWHKKGPRLLAGSRSFPQVIRLALGFFKPHAKHTRTGRLVGEWASPGGLQRRAEAQIPINRRCQRNFNVGRVVLTLAEQPAVDALPIRVHQPQLEHLVGRERRQIFEANYGAIPFRRHDQRAGNVRIKLGRHHIVPQRAVLLRQFRIERGAVAHARRNRRRFVLFA